MTDFTRSDRGAFARADRGTFGTGSGAVDLNSAGTLSIENVTFSLYESAVYPHVRTFVESVTPTVQILGEGLGAIIERVINAGPAVDFAMGILDSASGYTPAATHGINNGGGWGGATFNLNTRPLVTPSAATGSGPYTASVSVPLQPTLFSGGYLDHVGFTSTYDLCGFVLYFYSATAANRRAIASFDIPGWSVGPSGTYDPWWVEADFDMKLTL